MTGFVDDNQENVLEQAVHRFLDAQAQGQEPDIDELARQYPDLESQVRQRIQNLKRIDTLLAGLTQADESDFDETASG